MQTICSLPVDDGIVFQVDKIAGEEIRADAEYDGVRVWIPAVLDKAKTRLQVDIGFGDVVDPAAEQSDLPTMLQLGTPRLKVYPPEVAIAEKLQAMVQLDLANSRMKDFFDIWFLSRERSFQMSRLARALKATFTRRATSLPSSRPTALNSAFLRDKQKAALWQEFLNRSGLSSAVEGLPEIGEAIALFLMPVLEHLHHDSQDDDLFWLPEEGWLPSHHKRP